MNYSTSRIVFVAIAATLSAGALTQVQGQDAFAALGVPAQPVVAEEMEQQADALVLAGRGWEQAAALYLRAAELRGTHDLRAAANLWIAGYLEYYRGRMEASVEALSDAGEAFLALGDVERAAEAFIDGAWVAAQAEMTVRSHALSERARKLTLSPLLDLASRDDLVRRLGGAPKAQ